MNGTYYIEELLRENNWETKEEYGPYGSYFVHNWTGDAPPLDEAAAELSQLRTELDEAIRIIKPLALVNEAGFESTTVQNAILRAAAAFLKAHPEVTK
jgi:hypothetical protein